MGKRSRCFDRTICGALEAAAISAAFAIAAGGGSAGAAAAPSFDCSRASLPSELLICERPPLAKLDQQIADVYFALLEHLPPAEAEQVRQQQRQFLEVRDQCAISAGLPADCLESRMWARLQELQRLQAELTGAPLVDGGRVLAAPGVLWQAARPGDSADDAYRLEDGTVLCAVGLPEAPTIGTVGGSGCRIARGGAAVEEPAFHVLLAGASDHGWERAASASAPPENAVAVWRTGEEQVMVCRASLAGTLHLGTLTVGDACTVLFVPDDAGGAAEEVLVLAGFEVMTDLR